jgi:hypothetical protein
VDPIRPIVGRVNRNPVDLLSRSSELLMASSISVCCAQKIAQVTGIGQAALRMPP